MLGGIAFQLSVIIISTCFAIDYFVRFSKNSAYKMDARTKLMLFGMGLNTFFLIIR